MRFHITLARTVYRARIVGVGLAVVIAGLPNPAPAADFTVPSVATPTIFAAVAAAEVSPDLVNNIYLASSPIIIGATIEFDSSFGPGRRLTVRPVPTRARATIVMTAPGSPIIRMTGIGGNVTLQDLDLIRDITNASNLVEIMFYSDSILDRCRIGSNWSTPGATGYSNVYIAYPTGIVIRNCVCFSRTPGNFDTAIRAINFNDPANSLFLYNNVVADYRQAGIRIADGAGLAGSLVLLRNNIAVNHVAAAPEPAGYVSEVDGATTIVSSHNTAFATAGLDEALVGAAGSIAGAAAAFLIFPRPAAGATFTSMTWAMAPPWDVNPTLFHLIPGGPLHDGPAKFGQSVGWGNPHARDLAVLRDIDREPRPGGGPPHTDRGVDQLEPGTATHVVAPAEARPLSDARLDAIAIGSPGPSPAIRFAARDAGELRFELFDPEGRRIHTAVQRVRAGSGDLLYLERVARTGVYFYRLVLSPDEGAPAEVSGKVLMVR